MVHLFRLRNSLHGRNKLGVFLQSFNSLSSPTHPSLWPFCINLNFIFFPSLSPILINIEQREAEMQWSVVVIQVMDTAGMMIYVRCVMYVMYVM